jgi:hypothetical protein
MDTKQALQHIRFAIVLLLNLWWFSLDPLLNPLWLLAVVSCNRCVFELSVCKSSYIALFCSFWSSKRSFHVQQFRNHVFGHISIWFGFRFEANGFWQHVIDIDELGVGMLYCGLWCDGKLFQWAVFVPSLLLYDVDTPKQSQSRRKISCWHICSSRKL